MINSVSNSTFVKI